MRSARLHAVSDLRIHDETAPVLAGGEQFVHVKPVGICNSDLHRFAAAGISQAQLKHPLVLVHELTGERQEGQRVSADPAIPAGIVNMVIPVYVRAWALQSAIHKMAQWANGWRGMRTASFLRNRFEITTSDHRR